MNVRNLALAGILLAASSIPMTVSAHEEEDQQIVERARTYQSRWIAEHNYKHRLRLGRLNPSTEVERPPSEIDAPRSSPLYLE